MPNTIDTHMELRKISPIAGSASRLDQPRFSHTPNAASSTR
ncbi:Uncharacterised protein [Mycobacteroides abscessus subsp. abscessus]|nr:Uncharacterised protein [Mycobacteroides abscessus subsp. abscessus]